MDVVPIQLARFLLMVNDPQAARRLAEGMGESDFVSQGAAAPVPLDQVISLDAALRTAELTGTAPEQLKAVYAMRAKKLVFPGVAVPAPVPWKLDLLLTVVVFSLAAGCYVLNGRKAARSPGPQSMDTV